MIAYRANTSDPNYNPVRFATPIRWEGDRIIVEHSSEFLSCSKVVYVPVSPDQILSGYENELPARGEQTKDMFFGTCNCDRCQ